MDFRIQGVIELENRVGAGVASATRSLNELNEVVIHQWWGLQNIAQAFAAIGGAVTAGVGLAISETVRWEQAMADVQRTVAEVGNYDWETALDVGRIEQDIRDLAAVTPVAVEALAGIAAEAGALGIAAQDVGDFTEVVAGLAAVSDLTEEAAGVMFARISSLTGLPADQYENLASTILEVGRATAATETQINNLSVRLAAFLAPLGFTSDQVVALGAELASLGIQSERGATAIQKTMFDIITAIQEGGEEGKVFARIMGQSMEEVATLLAENPAEALTLFVEGLDDMRRAGVAVEQTLADLGIREARQVATLTALAKASHNAAAPQTQLRNVFELSANSFEKNAAFAQITSAYYATFAAQVTILRNKIDELQQMFGETLMPVLRVVNVVFNAFLDGLYSLPPFLRNAMIGLTLIAGAIAALTAAVFTIIPRIVLMRHSILSLQAASGAAVTGLVGVQNQANFTAISLSNLGVQANAAHLNLIKLNATGPSSALTATGGAAAGLTKWLGRAGKALGTLGVVLTAATVATTIFGGVFGRAERAVEDKATADLALTNIMRAQNAELEKNIQRWAADQLIMLGADQMARQLGVDMAMLVAIISGVGATQETWDNFSAQMDRAGDEGRELLDVVVQLRNTFRASSRAAIETAEYNADLTDSYEGLTDGINKAADAARKEQDALDKRNQALLAYGDAVLAAKQAQFSLADSQKAYEEALANAQDPSRVIADLEREIRNARWDIEDATRAVVDAEEKLKNARANQRQELVEAEWDLLDARDRQIDISEKIRDLEEELVAMRSGPTVDELRDATLRLQKAQVGLLRSQQQLADAEWYLNYLRAEGAGDRDIREAELLLEEARHRGAEAQDELIDSQQNLNDVRRGASPEEIARKERDLARAYRDSKRNAQDVKEIEREIAQLRKDIANDTAYKKAIQDLDAANYDLIKSNRELIKLQEELQDVMDGSLFDELARAELDLEIAFYNLAKANTEVTKQMALMRGEAWSAGHEAQELARQLGRIGADAPAAIRENLAQISAVLRRGIPTFAEDIEDGLSGLSDGLSGGGLGAALGDIIGEEFDIAIEDVEEESEGFFEKVGRILKENLPNIGMVVGGIMGGLIGGIPAIIGTALGYGLGKAGQFVWPKIYGFLNTISEKLTGMDFKGLVANGLGFWTETFGEVAGAIERWSDRVGEALSWENISSWFGDIREGISEWWNDIKTGFSNGDFFNYFDAQGWGLNIVAGVLNGLAGGPGLVARALIALWDKVVRDVKGRLGISSPSTVFARIGRDVIAGLLGGIAERIGSVLSYVAGIPGRIVNSIGNIYERVKIKGKEVITGIWNGLVEQWNNIGARFSNVRNWIAERAGNFYNTMKSSGRTLINGIWNGLVEQYNNIAQKFSNIRNLVVERVGNFYETMKGRGRNVIQGLYSGVVEKWNQLAGGFRKVGGWIVSAVGGVFRFGSPSRLTQQWGHWLIEGLLKGLNDEKSALSRMASQLVDLMAPDEFASLAEQYRNATENLFPQGTSTIRQVVDQRMSAAGAERSASGESGDTINVKALTQADPFKIASEIVWQKRVRARR